MAIQVLINGFMKDVTNRQLFALAKSNAITSDTEIIINGVHSTAGKAKGIVFGGMDIIEGGMAFEQIIVPTMRNQSSAIPENTNPIPGN